MKALSLYFRYALRSFIRGRSRSLFGAFCVAVGVTSVVALGLVGGNFHDAITGNAQKLNRGDVSVVPPRSGFSLQDYRIFAALKARGEITDYTSRSQEDTRLLNPGKDGSSTIGTLTAVDPSKFPFYDTIRADEPSGKPLSAVLIHPDDAVVSHDTLKTLNLKVGDRITVNSRRGFNHTYTIAGVVPDNAPDPGFGGGLLNDFAMVNSASTQSFFNSLDVGASTVYLKTRNAAQAEKVKRQLSARLGALATIKTVADVQKDSKNTADAFNTFFRIMGLVAVVIGGIGIVNTMLVAARRRTKEIGVLKALGMKGRQVVFVFTIESLLLALAGTVFGVLGGIGASIVVNNITESLAGYPIPWNWQGSALVAGAAVGIVATVLFAYLPVLRASRARPVAAIRDDTETRARASWFGAWAHSMRTRPGATIASGIRNAPRGIIRLPRRQGVRTSVLVLTLAAVMGYLAVLYGGLASGAQTVIAGVLVGIGTLVGAGLITQLFVLLVWLISKLPAMGRLPLRMAFRNMGTQKRRQGSTLLALCIGILAVGSIAILAQNLKNFIGDAVAHQQNMNVVVQSPHDAATIRRINASIDKLPGITHRDVGAISNSAVLASIDGKNPSAILQSKVRTHKLDKENAGGLADSLRGLEGRDVRGAGYTLHIKSGRGLTALDRGKDGILLPQELVKQLGARIGSHVVFRDGALQVPFTVVGTFDSNADFTIFGTNLADRTYMEHTGLTSVSPSHFSSFYLKSNDDVRAANVATLQRAVGKSALVLDLTNFLSAFTKVIDKFALFPEIIAALSLFAGAVIIANTVALAMLERRREIGVMKAVGARRRTILQFLLVENAVVGFLGAGVGVLLAMLGSVIVNNQFLHIGTSFDPFTIAGLIALGMGLAMGASALTALPASSEKPLTVLRYE